MAKYRVGDIVTVRPDLTLNAGYNGYFAVEDMVYLKGKMVKIIEILGDSIHDAYHIENSPWIWTNSMFEEEKYNFPSKSDLMQLLEG